MVLGWSSCTLPIYDTAFTATNRLGVPFVFFGLQVGRGRICGQQQQPLTYPNYAKIFASYLYLKLDPHPPIEGDTKTRMRLVSNFPPNFSYTFKFPAIFHLSTPSPLSPSPSRPPPFALPPSPSPLAPLPPSFLHLGPSPQLSAILAAITEQHRRSSKRGTAPPHRPITSLAQWPF